MIRKTKLRKRGKYEIMLVFAVVEKVKSYGRTEAATEQRKWRENVIKKGM